MRKLGAPLLTLTLALVLVSSVALADGEDDVERARSAFREGTELVQKAQWAEALAAFERARALRKHPVTTFDMAACERAMGHYTRARALYTEALDEHGAATEAAQRMPESLVGEARAIVGEIDRLLVRLTLTVEPPGSTLAVDGRPLLADGKELVAGLRPAGPGDPTPTGTFVVALDPGPHVLLFARRGFRDVTIARSYEAGRTDSLRLELTQMPATIRISASKPGAIVTVNGADVGPAPVNVLRPAGTYRVVVRRDGFVPYDTHLALEPGQDSSLRAELAQEKPSLFSRWWFWTIAGVVLVGATTTTYLLTRPDPERPDVDAGTLGWKVDVR